MKKLGLVALVLALVVGLGLYVEAQTTAAQAVKLAAQQAGHAKFRTMHFADQHAFVIKHLASIKTTSPPQAAAVTEIMSALDSTIFDNAKKKQAGKIAGVKALLNKHKHLFSDAEFKVLVTPNVATLAGGLTQVRRYEMCNCDSTQASYCSGTCSANGRCNIWFVGCGWLLLGTCDGWCLDNVNGQPEPCPIQ